ncbi:MAG: hypothetical protein ABIQ04_01010 [Candidatus Saccharimonadales bacterium]
MVLDVLKDFLIATTGASASFIGLLFVALSLESSEKLSIVNQTTKRILAESSYTALLNIFFISLVALIPNTSLGYVMVTMAAVGILNTIHFFRVGPQLRHNVSILIVGGLFYVAELLYGIFIIFRPEGYIISNNIIMGMFIFLFGAALARAWELTGIRKR